MRKFFHDILCFSLAALFAILALLIVVNLANACELKAMRAKKQMVLADMVLHGPVVGGAAIATDSCTGGLLFSWHMENLDVTLGGVAGGVNNGCSAGDTTGTAASLAELSAVQAHDGTNSLSIPTTADYVTFSVAANDIVSETAGTVILHFYVTTWLANANLIRITNGVDNINRITIYLSGTDELGLYYLGNSVGTGVITTDANMVVNNWYTVTAKWTTAAVDPNTWIQVCDTNGANCSTVISGNTQPTAMTVAIDRIKFGEDTATAGYFFLDNVKIYGSYL